MPAIQQQRVPRPKMDQSTDDRSVNDASYAGSRQRQSTRSSFPATGIRTPASLSATYRIVLAGAVVLVMLAASNLTYSPRPARSQRHPLPHYLSPSEAEAIQNTAMNRTLGFEKIMVLSLPNRHDRHDEFSLLASAYGLDIERVDGVRPHEMHPAGQPNFDDDVTPTERACWRAHVRMWRRMVEEKISTALIIEDDADFDVNLKPAMSALQRPLHVLFDSIQGHHDAPQPTTEAPWMHSEWEMLYLGACMEYPFTRVKVDTAMPLTSFGGHTAQRCNSKEKPSCQASLPSSGSAALVGESAPYVVYHDPTVADLTDSKQPETPTFYDVLGLQMPQKVLAREPKDGDDGGEDAQHGLPLRDPRYDAPGYTSDQPASDRLRVVGKTHSPWCLTAYALTYRGALRLLYHSTRYVEDAVDWQTINASRIGWINSYTVYPPLFDQFKMVNSSWNSDINVDAGKNVDKRGRKWHPSKGRARHIRRSARREMLLGLPV